MSLKKERKIGKKDLPISIQVLYGNILKQWVPPQMEPQHIQELKKKRIRTPIFRTKHRIKYIIEEFE